MGRSTGVPHIIETIEQLVAYSLFGVAVATVLCGLCILLFWVPARVTVITNGRERAEKDLQASIILNGVYTNGVKYSSYKIDDLLQFSTEAGEDIRVAVRRSISRDPASLIWYSPAVPQRFTTRNPIRCFVLAAACVTTAVLLRW